MSKKVINPNPTIESDEEVQAPPPKPKAPCSEKHKEHLARIRLLASEKRRQIAAEKMQEKKKQQDEIQYKANKYDEIKKEKEEAKLKAEQEERIKVEQEAKLKAEQESSLQLRCISSSSRFFKVLKATFACD